eukprot:TRINITY_DN57526_c0_g1_i1.p1 TRINITY_DN57526_c0_g1~~TRINITY_DN57526_c0_g1_i1.p1  ORF type:complete len:278 (+),score=66.85 TRINITY_DN57526_c0_g1_i1:86-919(+)
MRTAANAVAEVGLRGAGRAAGGSLQRGAPPGAAPPGAATGARRAAPPLLRAACSAQSRHWSLFGRTESKEDAAERQRAVKEQMREVLPHEEKWIAEAMWKGDRPATMRELIDADPYGRAKGVDDQIARKGHPLQHGIKAALHRRRELLAEKQAAENAAVAADTDPATEGMSAVQRQVYKKIRSEHEAKFRNKVKVQVPGYYDGINKDEKSRRMFERYLRNKSAEDPAELKRMNLEGIESTLDVQDMQKWGLRICAMVLFAGIIVLSIEPYLLEFGLA